MTNYIRSLLLPGLLLLGRYTHAQDAPVAIIPEPVSTQWHSGNFALDTNTVIMAGDSDILAANFFNDYLRHFYGLRLHINKNGAGSGAATAHTITLRTESGRKNGRYHLETSANN